MRYSKLAVLPVIAFALVIAPRHASAQFAVIDVASLAQLVEEVARLEEQLVVMRDHLEQAREEYAAITGGRGYEHLLENIVRNYLPADWQQLADAIEGARGAYGNLAASIEARMQENAVLTDGQLALLTESERRELIAGRRAAAGLQALTRQALEATSERFAAIQALIDAIPTATDAKAILDLEARISAEQDMLVNDATKIQTIFQTQHAEEWARQQRQREKAIADIGSLRDLPDIAF